MYEQATAIGEPNRQANEIERTKDLLSQVRSMCDHIMAMADHLLGPTPRAVPKTGEAAPHPGLLPQLGNEVGATMIRITEANEALARIDRAIT